MTGAKSIVLPITLKQQHQVGIGTHPDCIDELRDRWMLPNTFLVTPCIDLRRLRRAIMQLRNRHDVLRLRFEPYKDTFQAVIDPAGDDILQVVDLGDLDDEAFRGEISALTNASMTLVGAHMFEVIVAKCGKRGDVLIVRSHHTISDGYGMVVLFEDLSKFFWGVPVQGKAVSFVEYVNWFQLPPPGKTDEYQAFWDNLHKDLPPAPNVGRKGKGLVPNNLGLLDYEQSQIDVTASPESVRNFEARVLASGTGTTAMLFCAHLESLCQTYDLEKVTAITHVTRTDPALNSFVGDHTLDAVFPYISRGNATLVESSKAYTAMMTQMLLHLPSDTARRLGPYQRNLMEKGIYPDQFSVYQPRVQSREKRSIFGGGLGAGFDVPQTVGPYTVTHLNFAPRRRSSMETQFNIGSSPVRSGFSLHFDSFGYSDDEMRKLCAKTCALLEFDPIEVNIW